MFKEQVGIQDRNYNRPLTEDYSEAYKAADEGARKALMQGGRQYNDYLDNLKKDNEPAYNNYISAMDGNHVSPEYWKAVSGGDPGKIDLATFNMMKNRKKQLAKDLGKNYDPIYDLTDEQARSVLQQKSTATGDDIALRNALYKEQWYKDYMAKVKDFYDTKDETDSDFEQTQRVRDWYGLNDQYNALRDPNNEDLNNNFPLIAQQKAITAKYGFGSEEGKAWFKNNADAYEAEKEAYDAEQLRLINEMRKIEGYPPMSADQFKQVTEVADTDGDDKKKGYGSNKSSFYGKEGDYGQARALNLPSVKIKVNKVKIEPRNKPKTVKIVRKKLKA
jgi:protein-tyrosine-phosphatase